MPCASSCPSNLACGRASRAALANLGERTCRVRRAASQTWRAAVPCELLLRISASEPDVLAEAPRESRRAVVPCEPLLRIPASESVLRVEPLREAALRAAPPNVRRRQDFAVVRSWAAVRGNILARCVPGYPWQFFVVVRSRAAIRGNFLASCIPEGASDGKSAPSWQHILPGRVPFRRTGPSNHTWGANFAKEPPLYGPLESRTACESCQRPLESRTACESCQGPHCTGLSNLAREPLLTA